MIDARWSWTLSSSTASKEPDPIPSSMHISSSRAAPASSKPEDWCDVVKNGELLKRVVRDGALQAPKPCDACRVKMMIEGRLPSGDIIDQYSGWFVVGYIEVVRAIDVVVLTMKEGEVCQVKSSPSYAYGSQGRPPEIPPNTCLLYELELLEVQQPIDYATITNCDLISHLQQEQANGKKHFQQNEHLQAIIHLNRVSRMIESFQQERRMRLSQDVYDVLMDCLSCLATAQFKVGRQADALRTLDKILQSDPQNLHALFNSAQILSEQQLFEEAITRLQMAARISQDKDIMSELQRTTERQKEFLNKQITGINTSAAVQTSWSWILMILSTLIGITAWRLIKRWS